MMSVKMNGQQFAIIMMVALGSLSYGYAAGIISTTLGQPTFLDYFGLLTRSNANSLISAIVVGFQCGGFAGALLAPWSADRFGRKAVLAIASGSIIVTSAIQAGSVSLGMFLAFRTLGGMAVGIILVAVPLYQSEIAPAPIRGRLVAMHGMMLALGYVISSWFSLAFYFVDNGSASWRTPLAIQVVFPAFLLVGLAFIPESPRWLVTKQRVEEARTILRRLHVLAGQDYDSQFADQELESIVKQEEVDKDLAVGWLDLLRVPSYRKRSILAFVTMLAYAGTGTLTITNYLPSITGRLGYDSVQQLCLAGGYITYAPFGNIIASWAIERYGRKKLLYCGMIGSIVALIGETVTVTYGLATKAGQALGVVFLFVHLISFATFLDATTFVYATEIWPQHLRAKGLAVGITGFFTSSIIWLGSAPTAFAAINQYFYIVFIVLTCCIMASVWKFWPETKGLPLESIGALFGDQIAGSNQDYPKLREGTPEDGLKSAGSDHLEA